MYNDEPILPGQDNRKSSKLNEIKFPIETYDLCKSTSKSHADKYMTQLANGYCVNCWDGARGGCLTQNDAQKLGKKSQKKRRESKENG